MNVRIAKLLPIALIVILQAGTAWLAWQGRRAGTPQFWWLVTVPSVVLAIGALGRARREGVLGEWIRPRGGDIAMGFVVALACFGGAYAFMKLVTGPRGGHEIWFVRFYLQLGDPETMRGHTTVALLAMVVFAAAQEIVWRGLVARLFADALGERFAWAMQAVAASIAMVPTLWALAPYAGAVNPLLVLGALGGGAVFGLLAQKLGRLAPSIVAHAAFLYAVLVLFRLWGENL